jgi:hypothetical protein
MAAEDEELSKDYGYMLHALSQFSTSNDFEAFETFFQDYERDNIGPPSFAYLDSACQASLHCKPEFFGITEKIYKGLDGCSKRSVWLRIASLSKELNKNPEQLTGEYWRQESQKILEDGFAILERLYARLSEEEREQFGKLTLKRVQLDTEYLLRDYFVQPLRRKDGDIGAFEKEVQKAAQRLMYEYGVAPIGKIRDEIIKAEIEKEKIKSAERPPDALVNRAQGVAEGISNIQSMVSIINKALHVKETTFTPAQEKAQGGEIAAPAQLRITLQQPVEDWTKFVNDLKNEKVVVTGDERTVVLEAEEGADLAPLARELQKVLEKRR